MCVRVTVVCVYFFVTIPVTIFFDRSVIAVMAFVTEDFGWEDVVATTIWFLLFVM
jgi:hypothetical protein